MRHRNAFKKLGRTSSHRWAMMRNQLTSLVEHNRIITTLPKAKNLKPEADKLVTLAKDGSLPARRRAAAIVRSDEAVQKLFSELAERFESRPGGYTRVLKLGPRKGDNAQMAAIEYVEAYQPKSSLETSDGVLHRAALFSAEAEAAEKATPKMEGDGAAEGMVEAAELEVASETPRNT